MARVNNLPDNSLKLAIINITGGGISGGYRKYLTAIVPRLAAFSDIDEILCVAPASLETEKWLAFPHNVKFALCEPFKFMRHSPDTQLKLALDSFIPDVIFIPLERCMKYGNVPFVTMLQNMAPLSNAHVASNVFDKIKCMAQAFEAKLAVKCASAVIAPTDYVKNFLTESWNIKENKITTIHYGFDKVPLIVQPPSRLNVRSDLPSRFIFTAGAIETYRGIEDLIQVMIPMKKNFPKLKLLIAGDARSGTRNYFNKLKNYAKQLDLTDKIIWLGNLPEEELSWCYLHCAVFIMTSRVESFGLVALEAMTHGCNCISSNSSCLPEIFQDTALYYTPGDIVALEKALLEILNRDPIKQAIFKETAIKRASSFSWDITAHKTLEIIKKLAKLNR